MVPERTDEEGADTSYNVQTDTKQRLLQLRPDLRWLVWFHQFEEEEASHDGLEALLLGEKWGGANDIIPLPRRRDSRNSPYGEREKEEENLEKRRGDNRKSPLPGKIGTTMQ